jgi:hypothetical protein
MDSITEKAKYRKKIFPNELEFMQKYRGAWYSRLYYMVKSLHYLSLRDREKAAFYFKNGVIGKPTQ